MPHRLWTWGEQWLPDQAPQPRLLGHLRLPAPRPAGVRAGNAPDGPPDPAVPSRRRRRGRNRLFEPSQPRIRNRAWPLGPARRPLRARLAVGRGGTRGDRLLARGALRRPLLGAL